MVIPVKIDELAYICREWHIELVEDAAESIGSFYKGYHTGTFGRVGAISFNGNKTITTGGGGMLLFQDEERAYTPSTLLPRLRYLIVGSFVMTILVIITGCRISMPL